MTWSRCVDVDDFLARRGEALRAHEALYNLSWAAIGRAQRPDSAPGAFTFLSFNEGPRATAHALVSHQAQHLIMSAMSVDQATQLIDTLDAQGHALKELEGPIEAAQAALLCWSSRPERDHHIKLKQGLYELTQVHSPDPAGGRMSAMGEEHTALLQAWVTGFWRDCFPGDHVTPEQTLERAERLIREGRAYLWSSSGGEPVSMAAVVRESPNTTSISGVYTPPQHRGQGYAGRVVAALSQAQLDAGKRSCNLHTDLSNPTSNELYIRVGYRQLSVGIRATLLSKGEA